MTLATLAASCTTPAASRPDLLFVPANATLLPDLPRPIALRDGRSVYEDGSAAVRFEITGDRDDVTNQIIRYFEKLEWRQRPTQYMNTHIATSFDAGWQGQCACILVLDAQGNPVVRPKLYRWQGGWENKSGDVVTYSLYAEGGHVRGSASYVPIRLVRASIRRKSRYQYQRTSVGRLTSLGGYFVSRTKDHDPR